MLPQKFDCTRVVRMLLPQYRDQVRSTQIKISDLPMRVAAHKGQTFGYYSQLSQSDGKLIVTTTYLQALPIFCLILLSGSIFITAIVNWIYLPVAAACNAFLLIIIRMQAKGLHALNVWWVEEGSP
jgi:hypothetical protein